MKKFKFRLERVLSFRESLKSEKRRALSLRTAELKEAESILQQLEEQERQNSLREGAVLSEQEVALSGMFAGKLQKDIVNQRLAIVGAQDAVEAAMAEYIEAAKDVESLVTLKKRKRAEYDEELGREEMKFLDELSIQKGNTFRKGE